MRTSPDPPFWWKPWLRLPSLSAWWQREREVKPGSLSHGFGYLTLDPSARLRRQCTATTTMCASGDSMRCKLRAGHDGRHHAWRMRSWGSEASQWPQAESA